MRNKMQEYSPKFHSSAPLPWWKVVWLSYIVSGKGNNLRESFYALDDPWEQSCICPLVQLTLSTFPEEGKSSSDWTLLKMWTVGLAGWASPDRFSQDHSPPIRFQGKASKQASKHKLTLMWNIKTEGGFTIIKPSFVGKW